MTPWTAKGWSDPEESDSNAEIVVRLTDRTAVSAPIRVGPEAWQGSGGEPPRSPQLEALTELTQAALAASEGRTPKSARLVVHVEADCADATTTRTGGRIERRRVVVDAVGVSASGVCLPDLHERLRHRTSVLIDHAAVQDDPFSDRLAGVLARGSTGVLNVATGSAVKPWSWADTWPVARIAVPRLGRHAIALAGSSGQALAFGPGHVELTPEEFEAATAREIVKLGPVVKASGAKVD